MKVFLYIDSDTSLEFKSRAKAFIFAEKRGLVNYCLLTKYDDSPKVSVFNTYLVDTKCVEYFETEKQAMSYIGSFL